MTTTGKFAPSNPGIQLRHVGKRFGDTVAVRPVDLDVAPARTTALIGPSGCGKSTLLRLIIGLITPDSGTIRVAGAPVTGDLRRLRHRMGYVIQDGGLFPHLTGRRNVTLLADHLGHDPARTARRVTDLAALTRLPEAALDRYPAELSGGQRQRVALMRALMLDPEVLLLDEPMGALDPLIRSDLQSDLREIFRSLGKTVVLVTHDLGEAAFLADHVVLLRDGAIEQRGPVADLLERPATPFVRRFVSAQRGLAAP